MVAEPNHVLFDGWASRYLAAMDVKCAVAGEDGVQPITLQSYVEFQAEENDVMWTYTFDDGSNVEQQGSVSHADLLACNKHLRDIQKSWTLSSLLDHVEHTGEDEFQVTGCFQRGTSRRRRIDEAQFVVPEAERSVYESQTSEHGPEWSKFLKLNAKERKKGFAGTYDGGWKVIDGAALKDKEKDGDKLDGNGNVDNLKHPRNPILKTVTEVELRALFAKKARKHDLTDEDVSAKVKQSMETDFSGVNHGRDAGILPGNIMESHPDLDPESVADALKDIPNKKEKASYVRRLIMQVIFLMIFPKEYVELIAAQTNLQVELEMRRHTQAMDVGHLDSNGRFVENFQGEGKKYQKDKQWYQRYAQKKAANHKDYEWYDIIVYWALMAGTGVIHYPNRKDTWKKGVDILPSFREHMSLIEWKKLNHYVRYHSEHENEDKYWPRNNWERTPDIQFGPRPQEPRQPDGDYSEDDDHDRTTKQAWFNSALTYKYKELLDHLNQAYEYIFIMFIKAGRCFAFDETMIKNLAKDRRNVHIKGKPIPFGIKFWQLAISSGLLAGFALKLGYCNGAVPTSWMRTNVRGMSAIGTVVYHYTNEMLVQNLVRGSILFTDQFFTSLSLARALNNAPIRVDLVGTIQSRMIPKECAWKDEKTEGKYVQLKTVAASGYAKDTKLTVESKDGGVVIQRWKDKGKVFCNMLATCFSACYSNHESHSRHEKKTNRNNEREYNEREFWRWLAVDWYNHFMNAVDLHDMLSGVYSFSRRAVAKKGDGRTIDFLLGSSFAQMYILYKAFVASCTYGLDEKDLKLTHMQFMCELICMLLALAQKNGYKSRAAKRGRKRKRDDPNYLCSRLDEKDSFFTRKHKLRRAPVYNGEWNYGRCEVCHVPGQHSKKRARYYCTGCIDAEGKAGGPRNRDGNWPGKMVHLCSINCFERMHIEEFYRDWGCGTYECSRTCKPIILDPTTEDNGTACIHPGKFVSQE